MARQLTRVLFLVLAAWFACAHLTAQLVPQIQESGNISVSIDAVGSNSSAGADVQVQKPAGATVRSAFLSSCSLASRVINNGDVSINGTPVSWDASVFNNAGSNPTFFHNTFANVTGIVAPVVNAAAPGLVNFTITEVGTTTINGSVLVVIFDDPNVTNNSSVLVLFGGQDTNGDQFLINLANPIDPNVPGAVADMSLAIGHGFQGSGPNGTGMDSQITINGTRMTSSAGGEDDGGSFDGGLITVGGIGDSNANPANPLAASTNFADDDELYSLLPFLTSATTQIVVDTLNMSDDDNIFLAVFQTSVPSAIGESILLSPVVSSRDIGTTQTMTARVVDNNSVPVQGRQVTIQVQSGPNAGVTGMGVTDANGLFIFSYTSTTVGLDTLIADMQNSQGNPQSSNTAAVNWTTPNECWMMIGLQPLSVPLGPLLPGLATNADVLLVDPIVIMPMTLAQLPQFLVPSVAPTGVSIYTQGFMLNPGVFPNAPIKVSQALEWQIGVSTQPYGSPNGLSLWSTSPASVLPGQMMTMAFSIY